MKIISILLLLTAFCYPAFGAEKPDFSPKSGWITIPAGAKQAYMGIHGGTMPISLLVSNDGSAFLSFVGKTGNDFLEALRFSSFPVQNSIKLSSPAQEKYPSPALFAGNATTSLPVFTGLPGNGNDLLNNFSLFGFSQTPLSVEGNPVLPTTISSTRKYRNFYLPGSLSIRKK